MQRIIHAIVRQGDESGYVGEVAELNVVTQGATLDDVARNLREAVGLALESEDERVELTAQWFGACLRPELPPL